MISGSTDTLIDWLTKQLQIEEMLRNPCPQGEGQESRDCQLTYRQRQAALPRAEGEAKRGEGIGLCIMRCGGDGRKLRASSSYIRCLHMNGCI